MCMGMRYSAAYEVGMCAIEGVECCYIHVLYICIFECGYLFLEIAKRSATGRPGWLNK